MKIGGAGPVYLPRAPIIQCRRVHRKDVRQFLRQVPGKGVGFVDEQNSAAEGIEVLHVLAARDRILGPPFGLIGEAAGDEGRRQKAEQRDPILGIGDRERSDGRQEIEVEGDGRR